MLFAIRRDLYKMHTPLKCVLFGLLVTSVLLISGCSSQTTVPVKVTVIFPEDVSLGEDDSINLGFIPTNEGTGKSGVGHLKSGETTCDTRTGPSKGLEPGEYRITVNLVPSTGGMKQSKGARKSPDEYNFMVQDFNRRFNSKGAKLRYTVTNDPGQEITVNLKEETVTAAKK